MLDPEVVTVILASMEDGMSLRKASQAAGVSPQSFLRAVDASPELQEHYASARARMLDAQAEELEDIGNRAANAETAVEVAGLRLLADNRKWLLSKLAPKKYGDRLTQEITGADGGPINNSLTIEFVNPPQ